MPEARRQSSDVRGRRSETRGGVGARRSEVRGFATESACLWQAATGEKGHFLVSIGVNQRQSAVTSGVCDLCVLSERKEQERGECLSLSALSTRR